MTRKRRPRERWAGANRAQWFLQRRRRSSRERRSSSASSASRPVALGGFSARTDPAAVPGEGRRAVSVAPERNALRMTLSPLRRVRAIDDDVSADAIAFLLASFDHKTPLTQACKCGAGSMGKPAHCGDQLVDRRAALASQKANDRREF